jgi:hypothetical protein
MHVVGRGAIPRPTGVVLSCAAAGVVKTLLMKVQEPFAGLLNRITPNAKLVPALAPEKMCVSDEAVRLPLPILPFELFFTLAHLCRVYVALTTTR